MTAQLKKKSLPAQAGNGFTLVELILVMAVFLFIIAAALGIFLSVVTNQKKILAEQEFLGQTSYLEEYMSKAIRSAEADKAGACLPLGTVTVNGVAVPNTPFIYLLTRQVGLYYTGIKFINQSDNNACQEFFLSSLGVLEEEKNDTNDLGDINAVPLTPSGIKVNFIRFAINGKDGSVHGQGCDGNVLSCGSSVLDGIQPRVSILLNVSLLTDPAGSSRTIQTMVSQRNLNTQQ